MLRTSPAVAVLALLFGLGASNTAIAASSTAAALCADPAVTAAIETKETALIDHGRLPGSGLALNSLSIAHGIRITAHRIEVVGGQPTGDPAVAICRVMMHLRADTPSGPKGAEQNFVYRIQRSANSYTVAFCPNESCQADPAAIKLASPGPLGQAAAE